MTEDGMAVWHHQLDEHESEQAQRVGDGQGSLACCSPWGGKESDTSEHTHTSEMSYGICLFLIYFTLYDNLQVHQP